MTALIILLAVVTGAFGFSLGKTSNGMTSPRQSFNFFTGPFSAVLGAIIGAVATFAVGTFLANLLIGALVGFVAGLIGLGAARAMRGR